MPITAVTVKMMNCCSTSDKSERNWISRG